MNQELQKALIREFGSVTGTRLSLVVLPNITKDFNGMLLKAFPGISVKEDYIFEDRSGSVTLYGINEGKSSCRITKAEVHNSSSGRTSVVTF